VIIRNREQLLEHGNRRVREHALDILEAGLAAADPYDSIRKLVRIEGDTLHVGGQPDMDVSGFGDEIIDLREIEHIYVIGAGKAVQRQAKALEDILGDRLTAGAIIAKKGEGCYLERIEVTEGAHPVPDEDSLAGAEKIVAIAKRATERDLVFTIFSDGASSLFQLPQPGYTLDDLRALYRLAIKFGDQTVITRSMIYFSQVGTGRITRMVHPARSVNMILCTVPYTRWHGKLPTSRIFVPTWPSGTRKMADDVAEFQQEPWYAELPPRMKAAFDRLDPALCPPNLDDYRTQKMSFWQPVDAPQMVAAAKGKAEELGYHGAVLGLWSLVNCQETAHLLSGIARYAALHGQPFDPPVAFISTGELTVPVGDTNGIGGRNQEFVLHCARWLGGKANAVTKPSLQIGLKIDRDMVVASIDSDGTDGPGTQFNQNAPSDFRCQAGGIVDGETLARARAAGIDLSAELQAHNSSMPLWRLGDSIYTGNTGTCIGDLRVILVPNRTHGEE
jgi:glycerate 2-kinase